MAQHPHPMPPEKPSLWRRFWCGERGAVSVMFAVVMVPVVLSVGMAVDVGRAYLVKQRLGAAADAAGLAVASAYKPDTDMQPLLETYFNQNFQEDGLSQAITPSYTVVDDTVNVTAQATVDMTFMKILGIDTMQVDASSQITFSVNAMEVVMVLDNTGSMSGSKLSSLKSAAQNMVDVLMAGSNGNVKIGLVPFTATVNIGTSMSAFVSPDPSTYNWGNDSWWGCVMARAYPNDVEDTDTFEGGMWPTFYWADHNSYNNWYYWGYYGADTTPPSSKGPNKYCPNAITPLTTNEATLSSALNAMYAYGPTHVNVGAVWGWRVISPQEPFAQGAAYDTDNLTKVIILLTDGANTAYSSVKSAYDYPWTGTLGTTYSSVVADIMDDRLEETCTNIKDTGTLLYSITFDVDDMGIQNLMRGCATDDDKYFNSPGEDELKRTFRAIAKELKEIRLSD